MDTTLGMFAFAQATLPLLTALPILINYRMTVPLAELEKFYRILLGYFIVIAAYGLVGLVLNEGLSSTGVIAGIIYIALVFLSLLCSHRVAIWTIHELATRLTDWTQES